MRQLMQRLRGLWRALVAPEPDLTLAAGRIQLVERDLGLPVKASVLLGVGWFLYFSLDIEKLANTSEVALEAVSALQQVFLIYAILNGFLALPIWGMRHMPLKATQWVVYTTALLDAWFLGALTLVTDGFDSIVFWVFPLLVVRNALSMPVAPLQISLNLLTLSGYIAAGGFDLWMLQVDEQTEVARSAEAFFLRICLLFLLMGVCFALRVLVDRERERATEAAEFALRREQMRTAGRLAAVIAHQIKNPLGIINTAAFGVQRAVEREASPDLKRQLAIIREEVERADRILTELIGFAELAEGRVERLDVVEEIESALTRVFPVGSGYTTRIERAFVPPLPVLLFSRRSLGEVFDNLLKNARDALDGAGNIQVGARYLVDLGVEVTVADDGPGIPPENHEKIFEAYFTTKAGGTGLGLAIVKQNVELFGGRVDVESNAGKGTCFRLFFPGRTTLSSKD